VAPPPSPQAPLPTPFVGAGEGGTFSPAFPGLLKTHKGLGDGVLGKGAGGLRPLAPFPKNKHQESN